MYNLIYLSVIVTYCTESQLYPQFIHSIKDNIQPSHLRPLLRADLLHSSSASLPPSLITSTVRHTDRKRRKPPRKRGQNEKNCSSPSPWTRGLWLNLKSAGQTRTPPSARAALPTQNNAGAQAQLTDEGGREVGREVGEKKQKVCDLIGGRGERLPSNLGGVIWCMRRCIV